MSAFWPVGDSEMARRIREHDWAGTSIGASDQWPSVLKHAVDIMLPQGFPMIILWGPDLIQIYNDGYRDLMLNKHPAGLGQRTRECWPEVWHLNEPIYKRVFEGESVTLADALYPLVRNDVSNDSWLDISYSPLRVEGGAVQGVFITIFESTERKLNALRLAEKEESLRSAAEIGKLGLWDWNIRTGEVRWSDEHFRMQGYTVDEVIPSYEAWISRLHPDDRARAEAALLAARDQRSEYVHEFRMLLPDNSVRWASARGRFFYQDGEAVRMVGAMLETTERRAWEDHQSILIAELQHRTRNLIAVIRGISSQTARVSDNFRDFQTQFHRRLEALSRVQGLLSRSEIEPITIRALLELELESLAADGLDGKVTLSGQDVRIRNSAAQTLLLALHELFTNAHKYGALASATGKLDIAWKVYRDEGGQFRMRLDWMETGFTRSPAPERIGYGRELIERALPYSLSAITAYDLGQDSLSCMIDLPLGRTYG